MKDARFVGTQDAEERRTGNAVVKTRKRKEKEAGKKAVLSQELMCNFVGNSFFRYLYYY